MTTPYTITKSNGNTLTLIYPNESVGPSPGATGSLSTPFQVGCRYDIPIETSTAGQIILAGNVATLFGVGFKFTITGSSASANNTTFTVATSTYSVGPNQTIITASGLAAAATPGTCQLQVFTVAGDQTQAPDRFVSGFSFNITNPTNSSAADVGTYTVLAGHNAVYDSVSTYTAIPVAGPIAQSSPFVQAQYQLQYTLSGTPPSVIEMVGQDSLNWGAKIWENMVRMLENFAYTTSPDVNPNIGNNTPLFGQIWFDTTTAAGEYKYWNGTTWSPFSDAIGPFPGGVVNEIIAGTNVTISSTGTGGTGDVTINATGNVLAVSGTANEIVVSPTTGDVVVSLPQNIILPTPSSGIALTVNAAGNAPAAEFKTSNLSYAGDVSTYSTLVLANASTQAQTMLDFTVAGALGGRIRNDYVGNMTYVSTGSGGVHTFYVNGDVSVGSNGMTLGSSGVTVGNPSGGFKGAGTLNAQNLYVNGVAVGSNAGTVTSVNVASANSALTSTGGPIVSTGTITLTVNSSVVGFLANTNTWSGVQTFGTMHATTGDITTLNSTTIANTGNIGTASLSATGAITANGNITAYNSSDRSLKTNIVNISNALEKVSQINGVEFDWTNEYILSQGGDDGYFVRTHDVGVIAQEVELVLPEVVATRIDGTKAVKYDKIVALLIEAIKDLKAEIDILKGK
jgi:hypothetical protein